VFIICFKWYKATFRLGVEEGEPNTFGYVLVQFKPKFPLGYTLMLYDAETCNELPRCISARPRLFHKECRSYLCKKSK